MTSLDPSHIPGLSKKPRTGQAVHDPSQTTEADAEEKAEFPDEVSDIDSDAAELRARKEGKRKIRSAVPAIPDLRFEQSQSYLLSIRPFLTPVPTVDGVQKRGSAPEEQGASKSLVGSTEDDAVFHWGREMQVNWKMVGWVTVRDQIISPLLQGIGWGFLTLGLSASSLYLRQALYPASHTPQGRIVGGSGGSTKSAGGGSAVGDTWGYWRSWVKSWGGAVETAAI